mmetsp:Transcript_11806/g.37892  ORF Transcript_11806/g.37892 Transcript_11806/m.37892 type:complete len:205 (-) Transcript_11806:108-722(-)
MRAPARSGTAHWSASAAATTAAASSAARSSGSCASRSRQLPAGSAWPPPARRPRSACGLRRSPSATGSSFMAAHSGRSTAPVGATTRPAASSPATCRPRRGAPRGRCLGPCPSAAAAPSPRCAAGTSSSSGAWTSRPGPTSRTSGSTTSAPPVGARSLRRLPTVRSPPGRAATGWPWRCLRAGPCWSSAARSTSTASTSGTCAS